MDNNEVMQALNTAVVALFTAHAGGGETLTGSRYVDFDIEREALLAAHGVTMGEYLDWCEAMEATEDATHGV